MPGGGPVRAKKEKNKIYTKVKKKIPRKDEIFFCSHLSFPCQEEERPFPEVGP